LDGSGAFGPLFLPPIYWGHFLAALFCTFTPVLTPELRNGMLANSQTMVQHGWNEMFFKGITTGFLIAAMVWLVPSADTATFYVVTLMTHLIAVGVDAQCYVCAFLGESGAA